MAKLSLAVFVAIVAVCTASSSDFPYCADTINPIPALPSDGGKLVQVQVYIRHGDRTRGVPTPDGCWPDDNTVYNCTLNQWTVNAPTQQWSEPSTVFNLQYEAGHEMLPGNCGYGALTERGRQQQVKNGQALADAYITKAGLLPATLTDPSIVKLRADNSHRTQMSGQALFTAMYPKAAAPVAVPFYNRDHKYENIVPNTMACPRLTAAKNAPQQSAEFANLVKKYEPLMATVSKALGRTYTSQEAPVLFDCFFTHVCDNHPVPAGYNNTVANGVIDFVQSYGSLLSTYNNSAYSRMGMASLVKESVAAINAAVAGDPTAQKFRLYSGHDTGPIGPLLAAYGMSDGQWPPYASRISLELWQTNATSHAVRFEYNGKVVTPKGCSSSLCPLPEFLTISQGIIDAGADCATGPTEDDAATPVHPFVAMFEKLQSL